MDKKYIEHRYTEEAVCPYCGHVHADSFELSDETEVDCDSCGKSFHCTRDTQVTYITLRKEPS